MVARSLLSAATLASLALSATGFMAPSAAVVSTHRCAAASMKVFDWERRGTEAPEMESLDLSKPSRATTLRLKDLGFTNSVAALAAACWQHFQSYRPTSQRYR